MLPERSIMDHDEVQREKKGKGKGIVYAAIGEQCVQEAILSARSARSAMPGIPICLITNEDCRHEEFDEVVMIRDMDTLRRPKLYLDQCPYRQAIYIDSDTWILRSMEEIFTLLNRFDLALLQASGKYPYQVEGLPDIFGEYSSGLIGFNNTPGFSEFLQRWREEYIRSFYEEENPWDQRTFRILLWESPLRVANIPLEYSFTPYSVNTARTPLIMVHGRTLDAIKAMGREMDSIGGSRAWVPGLGCVGARDRMPLLHMLRLLMRLTKMLALEAPKRIGFVAAMREANRARVRKQSKVEKH